ncbi:hypothetical protein RAS2_24740 [Phycisphaerae bacterium RAS2]|nr:hypothetical protein RAS2_24740 [Phycisphaerae bacterium RAS2]
MNTSRILMIGSLVALAALSSCSQSAGPVKQAPDFTLDSLNGGKVSLAQRRGQVVLIGFWAVK